MSTFDAALFNGFLFGGAPPSDLLTVEVGTGLLYPALRKAAVTLGPGRTPSPAQFKDAIDELNRLIGSLNCDRLFIYAEDTAQYPILESKTAYTIGPDPSADFVAPRPQLITYATYISDGLRTPIPIATSLVYAQSSLLNTNGFPRGLYNDRAYPVSTLHLIGGGAAGGQLELFSWHQIPQFQSLTDVVVLPKQYEDALVLNLACRLAPHFQLAVHPDVRLQARDSLMRLLSINAPQPIADTSGLGCGCGYDVLTDTNL